MQSYYDVIQRSRWSLQCAYKLGSLLQNHPSAQTPKCVELVLHINLHRNSFLYKFMMSHDLNLKSQNLPQPLSWQRYLAIMTLLLLQLERQHLFLNFSRWPGYRNSSPNNSYRETSSGSRRSSRPGYSHAYCWCASCGHTILLCVCEEQQVYGIIQKEPTYNE